MLSKLKEPGYSFWSNRESKITVLPQEVWNSPYWRSLLLTPHQYTDLLQESEVLEKLLHLSSDQLQAHDIAEMD